MARAGIVSTPTSVIQAIPPQPAARRGAILIIEDRDDVRQGLTQLFELQGYMVFEAGNFQQALSQLHSSPRGIALILLDLHLPGPGGEAIRAAQLADPTVADIPVVVVSACSPDLPGSETLQAAAWVEKPFRFDQLLEKVRRFVVLDGSDPFNTPSGM